MKHIASLGVILVSALLLTGCLNYEQRTVLSEDGSGSLSIHYSVGENVMSWMENGNLAFTEDKVREQYTGDGIDIESVRITTEAEDSSRHVRVELSFDEFDRLSRLRGFKNMEFHWKSEGDAFRFSHTLGVTGSSDDASLDAFKVKYSYEFPGDILESNADSTYGRTAFWIFDLSEMNASHSLTARIKADSGANVWWILGIIAVVISLILVVFLIRRK